MTPTARLATLALLCPFCGGEGTLHSRAYHSEGLNLFHTETHRECPSCSGTGLSHDEPPQPA